MSQSKMTVATLSKPFQAASEPPRARAKAKSKHPPPILHPLHGCGTGAAKRTMDPDP